MLGARSEQGLTDRLTVATRSINVAPTQVASNWISDPQREKARTNHDHAHHDNSEETGRIKIFAHDDTCASIRQVSGDPGGKSSNHRFVSARLSPDRENDFIRTVPLLRCRLRTKHLHETERQASIAIGIRHFARCATTVPDVSIRRTLFWSAFRTQVGPTPRRKNTDRGPVPDGTAGHFVAWSRLSVTAKTSNSLGTW